MFGTEFYPTPSEIVAKMLEKFPDKKGIFLEPSAGKGDIAYRLSQNGATVYCVESDPNLISVLEGKKLQVVHDDFLTYPPEFKFDGIVMNPPFSNGDEHLLKALSIADGTRIVCLLNSETLANRHTKTRRMLGDKLEALGATFEELGDCFKDSERKTGVSVVMVTVDVPASERPEVDFGMSAEYVGTSEAFSHRELEHGNKAKAIVAQYHRAKELYDLGMQYFSEADRIMSSITVPIYTTSRERKSWEIAFDGSGSRRERLAEILDDKKARIWHYVSKVMGLEGKLTTKAREGFEEKMRRQHPYAVTEDNIRKFCDGIMANAHSFLSDSVLEAFDAFTKYYPENREHVEGWKSNDSWKVNRRIVMPNWLEFGFGDGKPRLGYSCRADDVERALCLLSGKKFENIRGLREAVREYSMDSRVQEGRGDSEFFEFRCFMKGTIHLYWKSEELREDFNIFVADRRGWLPPGHYKPKKGILMLS